MNIIDLLDRFEILYPDNQRLKDLRRSYNDRDLSSIFRFVSNNELQQGSVEDLRKAVLEQNLHSIFRLVDAEELKKLVLDDNLWSLWRLLDDEVKTNFVPALKYFYNNQINIDEDCFSRGQLKSKLWAVNELERLDLELGTVFLCAGWYATLSTMMFEKNLKITKVRSFDIDPSCELIAERFNKPWEMNEWQFKSSTANILDIDYEKASYTVTKPDGSKCTLVDVPNTIINTSCEHINDFDQWYRKIPAGKLVLLQTNNYFEIKDHVNCSASLSEFELQTPMTTCLYSGELVLDKYTRYMRIGYK